MADSAVSAINERASDEFFKRGQDSEKAGQHDKAVEFYERALSENPDNEEACFRLAVLYDRQADDAKAIELYERLCTSEPVHLNALINLSVLYEDNNYFDEARQCLEVVIRTNPNHERARLYMKDVESARLMYFDEDSSGDRGAALDVPITDFELSVRSRNCLKRMNIRTLGDLLKTSEQDLMGFKNFGDTSLNEIKALLAAKGLKLGQAPEAATGANWKASPAPGAGLPPEVAAKLVADLELSVRSRKALQRLNINTLGELTSRTEDELLGCKNFGQTSLGEIKEQLAKIGLSLRKLDE